MRHLSFAQAFLRRTVLTVVVVGARAVCAQGEPIEVESGFEAVERLSFSPADSGGGMTFTEDGDLLVYIGSELLRLSGDNSQRVLTSFDGTVFGSFLTIAPGGSAVIFGESSEGNVYTVALDGSGRVLTDTIPQNYDLVFDAQGRGLVSARLDEMQRIVLLDDDPNAPPQPVIVNIPGFSGPLALDDDGNLFYGTAEFTGAPETLYRFTPEQLEAGITDAGIDFSIGEMVLEGVGNFNDMISHEGWLFYTDLGFSRGVGSVQVVDLRDNFSTFEIAAFPSSSGVVSPTFLALLPGVRAFEAGSGSGGGSLAVLYSDFGTVHDVTEIVPQFFFLRGDANNDGRVDVSDVLRILGFVFLGSQAPDPVESADTNADGALDIADGVYVLNFLFLNGPPLPAPFPDFGPAR